MAYLASPTDTGHAIDFSSFAGTGRDAFPSTELRAAEGVAYHQLKK